MWTSIRHRIRTAAHRGLGLDLDTLTLDLTEAELIADLEYRSGDLRGSMPTGRTRA